MGSLILRNLFISIVLSVLLWFSLFGLGAWLIVSLGQSGLDEIQRNSSYAGLEVGSALARIAGERMSESKNVELSAAMKDIVAHSHENRDQRGFQFSINEIFLLNKNSMPLAHSDVTKMAKNSGVDFTQAKYKSILDKENNSYQSVYEKEIIESESFADGALYESLAELDSELAKKIKRYVPEKIATKYRLSIAVYRVDEVMPSGGIHLIVATQSVNKYMHALKDYSIYSLIWIYVSIFIITSIIFFLSLLLYYGTFSGLKKAKKENTLLVDELHRLESLEEGLMSEDTMASARHDSLNDDRTQSREAMESDLSHDGPTAAELEIMEEQKSRERLRAEHSLHTVQSSPIPVLHQQGRFMQPHHQWNEDDYLTGKDVGSELNDEEIYDAIPLDNLSMNKHFGMHDHNDE